MYVCTQVSKLRMQWREAREEVFDSDVENLPPPPNRTLRSSNSKTRSKRYSMPPALLRKNSIQ
eukprot:1168633-Amorphochlora_amoeboformis.AAC.1